MKFAILSILLVAVASASCQEIDVLDFLNGNVISPFLTDVTNGAINTLTSLLINLIGGIGKRDFSALLPQYLSIIQSVTSQFQGDLQTLFNGVFSSLSEIFGNANNFVGARRTSTEKTITKVFVDAQFAAKKIVQELFSQFSAQIKQTVSTK